MKASTGLLVFTPVAAVLASPAYPERTTHAAMPRDADDISYYFSMLSSKVEAGSGISAADACDISKPVMPTASAGLLPGVSPGLVLKHIAIGRGTQNYTCDTSNAAAVPMAIGANATLFSATCVAATYPDLFNQLPGAVVRFNLTAGGGSPAEPAVSGQHFFLNSTTPFFDLDTPAVQLGRAACVLNSSIPAPPDAPQSPDGAAAVPWLKLLTDNGTTGGLREVYRLQTAGGKPPATCSDMPATFEVQYAAQYWFYESGDNSNSD